ncbi:MAG: SPOR domain-containing protein [Spirochaetaceae bacterium]|nr:SPOR domain-containing protein [Spirochaetaceae bacterium]
MKRHSIALTLGLAALVALASASSWEGSAMMGAYGDFPSSGYYAACNSFARNTSVDVVNLENGRSVTVIVTRGLESSGVFMMLSVEAAEAIGLQRGGVTRVRASEPRSAVELAPSSGTSASMDPDINPRLLAAAELKRLGYELAPAAPSASAQPAVSAVRVEPAAPARTAPKVAEPAAPASSAPTASVPPAVVAEAKPKDAAPAVAAPPSKAAEPSAISREAPPAATAPSRAAIAEPKPVGKETPESLASSKPRPVRTIVLPQLPEPDSPSAKAAAAPEAVPEPPAVSAPEAVAMSLPVPDETPLRVAVGATPKRYESPASRPDVAVRGPSAPAVRVPAIALADPVTVSEARAAAFALSAPKLYRPMAGAELRDPVVPSSEGASALALSSPSRASYDGSYAMYDPAVPDAEPAEAFARTAPEYGAGRLGLELAWPELEADEIPEVMLAGLSAPVYEIPATSLADGEIVLPASVGPSALALETPEFGAAETYVAMEDAELEPEETPSVDTPSGLGPYGEDVAVELAEAEGKPEEGPVVDVAAGIAPFDDESVELAEAGRQPAVDEAAGLDPYAEGAAVELAEAGSQPAIDEAAGLDPYSEKAEVALSEAEAAAAGGPEAEAMAAGTPVDGAAGVALADASEHKPETAPYVAEPAEGKAPAVALDSPKEYIVAIEPTSPKPPVSTAPAAEAKPAETKATVAPATAATAATVVSGALEKGRYYIQIGAFASEAAAKDAASRLSVGYLVLIQQATSRGKATWKVFIGPLSRDESGVALVRVRSMGYRDAFVKSGG